MLFDNFDKKIKEAAEQHHPAYDENAWRKMEKLLDEHLPRQNNRRRFFLLAFSVLLIGGGAFVFLSKPHVKNSGPVNQQNNSSTNTNTQAGNTQTEKADKTATVVLPGVDNADKQVATGNNPIKPVIKIVDKDGNVLTVTDKKGNIYNRPQQSIARQGLGVEGKPVNERDNGVSVTQAQSNGDQDTKAPVTTRGEEQIMKNETPVRDPLTKANEVANNPQQAQNPSATKAGPKKERQNGMNGLSFFVATGPDVSKAQNSKAGKVTMSWGFGVAYSLNRFTLKTGVFSASKKYWAGPEDYKLSYTPPPSLKFMGADANCRVIEIPVKLSYNFAVKDRSNWFAGAGLSSYLMKREDYVYEYKSNTNGNSYYHSYETKNENKHYFSVLNLSGGYSYQLNKTFSVSAEPYLEVPLTGIGAGKVHLNSGGLLFTLGVSPFRK